MFKAIITISTLIVSMSAHAGVETCTGMVQLVGPFDGKTTIARSKLLVDPEAETVQMQFKDPDEGDYFVAADGKLAENRMKFKFTEGFSLGDVEEFELKLETEQIKKTKERFLSLQSVPEKGFVMFFGIYDCTLPKDKEKLEAPQQPERNSDRDREDELRLPEDSSNPHRLWD